MTTSTEWSRLSVVLSIVCASLVFVYPVPAAALATLGVAPLAYNVPNIGEGLAALLSSELDASGIAAVTHPARVAAVLDNAGVEPADYLRLLPDNIAALTASGLDLDYLLVGELTAFSIEDKDVRLDLGSQFRDLAALYGGGNQIAQVRLELRLLRLSDCTELARISAEGLESQHGTRMRTVTLGWEAGVDMQSDEFRQTMLGRAAYKAIGEAIHQLAALLLPGGSVIAVSGDSVVLDIGKQSGVELGDELTILRDASLANNLGQVVWDAEQRLGSVQVIELRPDTCLCLVLDGYGALAEGDLARPFVTRVRLPLEANSAPSS
jgi:hypothetical protein